MSNDTSADKCNKTRLRLPDRTQVVMKFESPDELIGVGHRARIVWRAVEAMDLSAFHQPIKAREGVRGRDATDPRVLVGLWLYATTRGVGSARELARLCLESRPYQWLCGGVTLNHHLLSDFRVDHGPALDELFTRAVAALAGQGLVKVKRISQDGTRVRACAGAGSFRRRGRLGELLEQARKHVEEVRSLLDDPARSAGLSAKAKAARRRVAREKHERVERAIAALPGLEQKQKALARKVSAQDKAAGKLREPRASTTDAEARVTKRPNGGFNPAVNVQFAADTDSRAVVGVGVAGRGTDSHLSEPMRQQVEARTGLNVGQRLLDGGYLVVERAEASGVTLFVPPKPPRNKGQRPDAYAPVPGESPALAAWRERMGGEQGRAIYKQRAATAETVNADAKTHRGLDRPRVRGLKKIKCVALWFALAYNVMHFAAALAA